MFSHPVLCASTAGNVIFLADIRRPRYGAGGVNNAAEAIVRRNSAVPVIFGREADKARAEMSVFTAALHLKFLPQIFGKIF